MADPLLLVGVDACVLIEAVHVGWRHPSAYVLHAAASSVFRLLLIENVEEEARAALRAYDEQQVTPRGLSEEAALDRLLDRCQIQFWPACSDEERKAGEQEFGPHLRHLNDAPIAVAIKKAHPHAFVSSNHDHWRPSLRTVLGDVPVMRPRQFLQHLGISAPAKFPKKS